MAIQTFKPRRAAKRKKIICVKNVEIFPNGMCMVFDNRGHQIPELQGKWEVTEELLKQKHIDMRQAKINR